MPRSTCNILNPQVGSTGANWDAIITSPDLGVENCDSWWWLHMNAISVWAVSGSGDFDTLHFHFLAAIDDDMEHLAVEGG